MRFLIYPACSSPLWCLFLKFFAPPSLFIIFNIFSAFISYPTCLILLLTLLTLKSCYTLMLTTYLWSLLDWLILLAQINWPCSLNWSNSLIHFFYNFSITVCSLLPALLFDTREWLYFNNILGGSICWYHIYVPSDPIFFFDPNIFWPKIFLPENFFWLKIFVDLKKIKKKIDP